MMKRRLHALAGYLGFFLIAIFWLSTAISELFWSAEAVAAVKNGILLAMTGFVPLMIAAGASGFALGGKSRSAPITAKRRRMPFIAMNGVFVLLPSAFFLAWKANNNIFDYWFYYVQGLELLAGAANLTLMGLNIRDGRRFAGFRRAAVRR